MVTQPATTEPDPPIKALKRLISRGEEISGQARVPPGALHLWINAVRSHLFKIYGRESNYLGDFPPRLPNLDEQEVRSELVSRISHLRHIVDSLETLLKSTSSMCDRKRIFIGHGRSPAWRELKDFVVDRLALPWDEFNREVVAGYTTTERLQTMMSQAIFAILVLTAEEEHSDSSLHARSNVIHEVGLFQGHLGLRRAIVLIENDCSEFSNTAGLSQLRFPRNGIAACFEEIRRVMERERLI